MTLRLTTRRLVFVLIPTAALALAAVGRPRASTWSYPALPGMPGERFVHVEGAGLVAWRVMFCGRGWRDWSLAVETRTGVGAGAARP